MASNMKKVEIAINAILLIGVAVTISVFMLLLNSGKFPTNYQPFDLNDQTLMRPVLPDTIGGVTNVLVTMIAAMLCMLVLQIFKYNLQSEAHRRSIMEVLVFGICIIFIGDVLVNLSTNILKNYRGGLRPHFIEACEINETIKKEITDKGSTWVDSKTSKIICTSHEKLDYRWSFPSGHASQAFYGMILSILILQKINKLKFATRDWDPLRLTLVLVLQTLAFTFACWVAIGRINDFHHHWWDVLAGGLLGTVIAVAVSHWTLDVLDAEKDGETGPAPLEEISTHMPLTAESIVTDDKL